MINNKKLSLLTASAIAALVMSGCAKTSTIKEGASKEAAAKALANVSNVSEQKADYKVYDYPCSTTFSYGADSYGTMAKSIYEDGYTTSTDFFKHLSNGKLIAVVSYDDGVSWSNSLADEELLAGKSYDFDKTYYGAEALINAIANDASCKETTTKDSFGLTATAEYADEYYSKLVSADVTFTLGSNDALDEATIVLTEYSSYTKNADGTYKTSGKGTATTYTVKNTCGEKMSVDPYNIEQYYATSWKLLDSEGNEVTDGSTINSVAGTESEMAFTFSDVLPSTADINFVDSPEFTCYQDGVECDGFYGYVWEGSAGFYYSSLAQGDYTIKVEGALYSMSFTLSLSEAKPTSFNLTNYTKDLDIEESTEREHSFEIEDNGTFGGTTYVNTPIYVHGYTNPTATGGSLKAECSSDKVTIEDSTVTAWGDEYKALKFSASEAGTYNITLSNADYPDSISMTYVLTVEEAPALSAVLAKKYVATNYNGVAFEVSFAPDATDATKGEVTIVDLCSEWTEEADGTSYFVRHDNTYTYTYDATTNLFALELKSGTDLNNTEWPLPTLGLSSRMLPVVNSNYAGGEYFECVLDTPSARLTNTTYKYGDVSSFPADTSNIVTYSLEFNNEGGIDLSLRDYRKAELAYDTDYEEYYYTNVDLYMYSSKSYSLTETEEGYTITADLECSYEPTEDALTKDDVVKTLTLSKDLKTITLTSDLGTYTLSK